MAHFKIQPPGVFGVSQDDRKPIIRVISGDHWEVSLNLYDPSAPGQPATPDTTYAEIALSETQFDEPIWTGTWYKGIFPDSSRKDLSRVVIPQSLTRQLRRGSYMFSVRVSDILKTRYTTEAEGSFLVEYKPTSEQHSIPYKDSPTTDSGSSENDGVSSER